MPPPNPGLVEIDIRQKPWARQAGEEQCLGDMPWVEPGDCNRARRLICMTHRMRSVNAGAVGGVAGSAGNPDLSVGGVGLVMSRKASTHADALTPIDFRPEPRGPNRNSTRAAFARSIICAISRSDKSAPVDTIGMVATPVRNDRSRRIRCYIRTRIESCDPIH
jgi:hypothetical protein